MIENSACNICSLHRAREVGELSSRGAALEVWRHQQAPPQKVDVSLPAFGPSCGRQPLHGLPPEDCSSSQWGPTARSSSVPPPTLLLHGRPPRRLPALPGRPPLPPPRLRGMPPLRQLCRGLTAFCALLLKPPALGRPPVRGRPPGLPVRLSGLRGRPAARPAGLPRTPNTHLPRQPAPGTARRDLVATAAATLLKPKAERAAGGR